MLVTGEGPPDKRAGAPTSSKVIQVILTTELRTDCGKGANVVIS